MSNNTDPKTASIQSKALYVDDGKPLKPLSNTVIDFIFRDADTGGEAMRGLANAILADSGDRLISSVIHMQPQWHQVGAGGRAYRLDVLAKTEDDETILLEVQMKTQLLFNTRSMVYAMEPLQSNIRKGDDWREISARMPRVISINILDFELRKKGRSFHQIIEPVYREPPYEVAEHHHTTHNIELPKFRRMSPDLSKPLHLWLTAICRAQDEGKTLREVVDMEPALKELERENQSFWQFIDNYSIANMDEETRMKYRDEIIEVIFAKAELAAQRAEAREEGREEGRKEGIEEARGELAPQLAEKDATLAEKDAEIERLRAELEKAKNGK